ncbi:MAG: hypothetical protein Q9192_007589 [Flavoplaca navasiana]
MPGFKRPLPSQDLIGNNSFPRKRALIGFPPPPTVPPPAPLDPSQWAKKLNASIENHVQPSTESSTQPMHQALGHETNSECLLPRQTITACPSFSRFSERPMPTNKADITMLRIIDEVLIPRYLESNPQCTDKGAQRKKRYIAYMKFNRLKLLSRIERWRIHIPFKEEDEELHREREGKKGELSDIWWDPRVQRWLMDERKMRDRKNMTDYVNGQVEAVNRGKLTCWPILLQEDELYLNWNVKDSDVLWGTEMPGTDLEVESE